MPDHLPNQEQHANSDIDSSAIPLINLSITINPISLRVISVTLNKEIKKDKKEEEKESNKEREEEKTEKNKETLSSEISKKTKLELYLDAFNTKFHSNYRPTRGREVKLNLRLNSFTFSQILDALDSLSASPFHHGENERGWIANPDFLIRSDEKVDEWLQKVPIVSEKVEFVPLTELEIWEIAGQLDVPVSVIRTKSQEIIHLAENGEMKKYPYAKNTKDTLIRWVTASRDSGRIHRMDEMDKLEYPTLHPTAVAEHNALIAKAKKDGLI